MLFLAADDLIASRYSDQMPPQECPDRFPDLSLRDEGHGASRRRAVDVGSLTTLLM
jgi:hypothetical protein